MRSPRRGALAVLATTALVLAACGGGDDTEDTTPAPTEATTVSETMSETEAMTETEAPTEAVSETTTEAAAGEPVGPACDDIAAEDLSGEPLATAASNVPALATLVTAVEAAGLGETLNESEGLTLFAPVDDAFASLPPDTLDSVLADPEGALTDILTLHVADGQLDAAALTAAGTVTTLGGEDLEFDGDALTVTSPGGTTANVTCANITTANATVHVIDAVLMPAS